LAVAMIEYGNDGLLSLIFKMNGSVFPRVLPYGLVSSVICLGISLTEAHALMKDIFSHPYAHQVFSISVGFVLVFRGNLSYQRFWEGRSQLQQMSTKWDDAAMQVLAFDEVSEGKAAEDGFLFRYRMVHLFSLMHAVAVMQLREDVDLGLLRKTGPILDANPNVEILLIEGGVTRAELDALENCENRVYCVMTWITRALVQRMKKGGLAMPPPILSRTYQVLSEGMSAYMHARKICDTPFPFPYAQLVTLLIIIFVVTAPVVIARYVSNFLFAWLLSFISTCTSVALNEVAKEIEGPFGYDPNDLPLQKLHTEFNQRIMLLLQEPDVFFPSGVQGLECGINDFAKRSLAPATLPVSSLQPNPAINVTQLHPSLLMRTSLSVPPPPPTPATPAQRLSKDPVVSPAITARPSTPPTTYSASSALPRGVDISPRVSLATPAPDSPVNPVSTPATPPLAPASSRPATPTPPAAPVAGATASPIASSTLTAPSPLSARPPALAQEPSGTVHSPTARRGSSIVIASPTSQERRVKRFSSTPVIDGPESAAGNEPDAWNGVAVTSGSGVGLAWVGENGSLQETFDASSPAPLITEADSEQSVEAAVPSKTRKLPLVIHGGMPRENPVQQLKSRLSTLSSRPSSRGERA